MSEKNGFVPECKTCEAKCCNYIAIEIDEPTCKSEDDIIRWYLLHENVHVFIDQEHDWHIEIKTRCKALEKNNSCSIYTTRPEICRDHGVEREECEFYGDPYKYFFSEVQEFEDYLKKKGLKNRK